MDLTCCKNASYEKLRLRPGRQGKVDIALADHKKRRTGLASRTPTRPDPARCGACSALLLHLSEGAGRPGPCRAHLGVAAGNTALCATACRFGGGPLPDATGI